MTPYYSRGDIILIPYPYIQDYKKTKTRPALVIQNNVANEFSDNLIIALISSTLPAKKYPMHYWIDINKETHSGLQENSIVKCEVIITIPTKAVIKTIGKLSSSSMTEINSCIKVSLAIDT